MRFKRQTRSKRESEEALIDAQRHRDRIKERTPTVVDAVQASKDIRVKNHFIEELETLIIGRKVRDDDK